MREKKSPRLGDMTALTRAAKSMRPGAAGEGVKRRRQMIAVFCRMMGEQLLDGKPALRGAEPLSRRQRQTLELLLNGDAEKQIAARLSISRHTVHVYVKSLYKRFEVNSRGELLAKWVQR